MTEEKFKRLEEIINGFPPLRMRNPPFKRPNNEKGEAAYSWLVNDWIPTQPDFPVLVELTTLLSFNMVGVVAALMGWDRFIEWIETKNRSDG